MHYLIDLLCHCSMFSIAPQKSTICGVHLLDMNSRLILCTYTSSQQIASLKAVTCVVLLLVIVCSLVAGSAMPPLCENRLIDELPPKFRKVCAALENSNQFAEALNAYIRKEAAGNGRSMDQTPRTHTDTHCFTCTPSTPRRGENVIIGINFSFSLPR